MKRDMDLCRKILEHVEENSRGMAPFTAEIADYSREEVSYHVMLLDQGGYLTAVDATTRAGLHWKPRSLTWQGHELLDAIRTESVWTKVKQEVKEKACSIPFEVLKALAVKYSAEMFGLG